MTALQATKTKASSDTIRTGRLFFLELSGDRIHSMNPDGSDRKIIITNCHLPDGIAVDAEAGHIYWTNMGIPNLNDGTIERADLDGNNRKVIIPQGITHTPKQIHLEKAAGKLYWSDREGMKTTAIRLSLASTSGLAARIPDFVTLMKPRVMALAVLTALVGLMIAPTRPDPLLGFIAILSIAAGGGAAGVLNMTNLNDNLMPSQDLMNLHMQH